MNYGREDGWSRAELIMLRLYLLFHISQKLTVLVAEQIYDIARKVGLL